MGTCRCAQMLRCDFFCGVLDAKFNFQFLMRVSVRGFLPDLLVASTDLGVPFFSLLDRFSVALRQSQSQIWSRRWWWLFGLYFFPSAHRKRDQWKGAASKNVKNNKCQDKISTFFTQYLNRQKCQDYFDNFRLAPRARGLP